MGTVTGPRGPRGGAHRGPRAVDVDYVAINNSTEAAYHKQTGNPSGINGNSTLKHLLGRLEKFLRHPHINDPYQLPANTSDNDAIVLYLCELSRWYERKMNANYPGNPNRQILDTIENANHKSCLIFLDSILQGISAKNGSALNRPPFTGGTETSYFVAYVDAIGNA
jgi:hypothetical protein